MPTVRFANNRYELDAPLSEMARKSVASFSRVTGESESTSLEEQLHGWVASLFRAGHSTATIRRYLQSLRSVYDTVSSEADASTAEAFTSMLAQINLPEDARADSREAGAITGYDMARRLAINTRRLTEAQSLCLDAFLYMVYRRGMTVESLLDERRTASRSTSAPDIPPQALALAERHRRPRCRRAFPFAADGSTASDPTTLLKKMESVAADVLGSGAPRFTPDTALSLWIDSALDAGIAAEAVGACIDRIPATHTWLRFILPAALTPDEVADITCRVADHINPRRTAWYAMKLRAGVNPTAISRHLHASGRDALVEEYFYPCREIARRTGKKLTFGSKPYIPDILFFKALGRNLAALFTDIGHMAWCYRHVNATGSDYASIPDASMRRFQTAIGLFTPDLSPVVNAAAGFAPGTPVRITAGPLEGLVGYVAKADTTPASTSADESLRRFSIRLSTSAFLSFEVSLDQRFLSPIPSSDLYLYPELASNDSYI